MKRFLARLALFLLPVVLVYGIFAAALINTRELADLDTIVAATVDGSLTLYGTSHNEKIGAYKLQAASALGARLMVLGTSRSMQLRGEFFASDSFYNAGGGVRNMWDFVDFLSRLPQDALPETLLVVLDQNFFNSDWRASSSDESQDFEGGDPDFFDTLLRTGIDYGEGKFSLFEVLSPQPGIYGLAAAARGTGFALDGSYRYGILVQDNLEEPQKNFAATYRQIDFGQQRFAYGDTPDALALEQLEQFLAFCTERGIEVVGFLPPYPPSVYQRMTQNGGYGYLDTLYEEIAARFTAAGGEFYDFTAFESEDVEYVDGFHGGDRVYARIALGLAEHSEILSGQIDTSQIESMLADQQGTPRNFPG